MSAHVALITGVAGQDGSYLAEYLASEGVEVHGVVRADDDRKDVPDGVTVHVADITDTPRMAEVLSAVAPTAVFHLAGMSSVGLSWERPLVAGQVTGFAVAGLLDAVWAQQTRAGTEIRWVQASSAEIFGEPETAPQTEQTPLAPVNPYGAAKAYAHLLTGVYRARGMHASTVVLYNHESPRRPEGFVTRKITAGVARIASGQQTELVLGNLEARRDWGWAPDYARAMWLASRREVAADYVIATGQAHSVREFVGAAFAAAGIDDWDHLVRTDPQFYRPVDAHELVGDASKAARELGWQPSVTFDEMVGQMVAVDMSEIQQGE
ncbi:GDP-mannose 4,6-dehydratase [Ornithinimicrobium sp. Arc0846-15]|nr:GDP-mannose 4,6-dehydratase [Ornithinimicrobium laminariae]